MIAVRPVNDVSRYVPSTPWRLKMKSKYDIIVVGAGPAGSMAAYWGAKAGVSVLLLEKDSHIGLPVRCAEGVGSKSIEKLVPVQDTWIARRITGVVFHSPSGNQLNVQSDEVGYVLHRKRFDYDLARMAAGQGAEVHTRAWVYDLIREENRIAGVKVNHLGQEKTIRADVVIGADGVESRVGRWAGLKTDVALKDMETCAQVTAANIDIDPDSIHLYFSHKLAPGGYLWIFPKGEKIANVGLGISGEFCRKKSPYTYLMEFMQNHFPQASILTTSLGGVTASKPLKHIVTDGLVLAGDAARHSNPLTGGGIASGMTAGKLAGKIAAAAVKEKNVSKKRLLDYAGTFNKIEGKNLAKFYKIKEFVYNLSDEDFVNIEKSVTKLPEEKRTLVNIFKVALVKKPCLIVDVIKLFT